MRYDLYINGSLVDINDESLIVLTYTMEQLNNPTAVKNTYSHEVTLPSTSRNDILFSHFYRNDYKVGVANFTPLQRVPFEIYNELSEIVEGGYIKLDEVSIDRVSHTYKVTLYGGLGSFFYAMGYDEQGEALTLGDLQYMANEDNEDRLDIRVNRATIAQAWKRIAGENSSTQYDVLNFAPTYQGKPDGDFSTDKAIFIGRATGSAGNYSNDVQRPIYGITAPQGSNNYYKRITDGVDTGYRCALVDLAQEHTEWEMKDLRSYLQRPILSVRKFFEAVQRRAEALGYTLDLDSSFFNSTNPYYRHAWLTLPSLQSISKPSKTAQVQIDGIVYVNSDVVQDVVLETTSPIAIDGFDFGTTIEDVSVRVDKLWVVMPSPFDVYLAHNTDLTNWCIQIYGKRGGSVVAWSDTKVLIDSYDRTPLTQIVAGYSAMGGTPTYELVGGFFAASRAAKFFTQPLSFKITTTATPDEWHMRIIKRVHRGAASNAGKLWITQLNSDGTNGFWAEIGQTKGSNIYGVGSIATNEVVRSGALIRKRELFDIGKTPMEVLVSFCKLFGLVWLYEPNRKKVSLMPRDRFYGGDNIDIEERIDRSKDMTIKPFEFDRRFYDFALETQGDFAAEYEEMTGRVYGAQRVNTGYEFDAESKNLLDNNALKGGAEVLEQGKYYTNINEGTYTLGSTTYPKICPSVFVDGGKYSLYDASGNAVEYNITMPTTAADIDYMNEREGYDAYSKVQLVEGDKVVSDGGMLLLYNGSIDIDNSPYKNFRLTDDIAEMGILNEGKMCWILEGSAYGALSGDSLPHFVRAGRGVSLDMGIPTELDNPDIDVSATANSIYSQYWRRYFSDRYSVDSRVCECHVDLRGLQVGNRLFRNFYYFDNAVWALNKISNYSMNTIGSTLCEFVKIQDISNYLED